MDFIYFQVKLPASLIRNTRPGHLGTVLIQLNCCSYMGIIPWVNTYSQN